jgi:dinuclear metal center YbgI/SA1388 family protein
MVRLNELVTWSNNLLQVDDYQDYCPNGLQVEGGSEVRRVVSGVTASLALIEAAVVSGADTLLVHHGWFWSGEDPRVVGLKQRRLKLLLGHDITLLAYHLPLDGHPELGNNAQLARVLGLTTEGRFGKGPGGGIALYGALPQPMSGVELAAHIARQLHRTPLHVSGGERVLRRIGWCSGAAQGWIEQAAVLGLDGFISGEVSEATVHAARELGIDYFAAGHHATERYGVQALGDHLARKFAIDHEFIEIDNPV